MSFKLIASVLVAAACTGCAFTPQAIVVSPKLDVKASKIGGDKALAIDVIDERPRQTLGTRGAGGNIGAELTLAGDLKTVVQNALAEGLAKQSFKMKTGGDDRQLRVEIRTLDYAVIRGMWAGTLRIDVGLKATCMRGTQRQYEQLHRGEFSESIQVIPRDEANNAYVSEAVSNAVNAVLRDEKLSSCLAA
jgi:uncharacterized lipoprotein